MSEASTNPGLQGLSHTDALARPLCVDLDGTLVATDTLWEAVLRLIRSRPWTLLMLPLWLLGGRAKLKQSVAEKAELDPAGLPYREELLAALRQGAEAGRPLVLATAADRRIAAAVAEHVGCFGEVLASDGDQNLKAQHKRSQLEARFGPKGFDYIGDSSADLVVFEGASRGYMVGASASTAKRAERIQGVEVISRRPPLLKALIKVLRPHQWAKNALVFAPVLLSPALPTPRLLVTAAVATGLFCMAASAGYVLNDLLDLEADRAHATKKTRPFASGALPVLFGPPLFFALLLTSFGVAATFMSLPFAAMLAAYFVGTISYSLWLKSKLLVDVLMLAWLYTHRILAGGVATEIPISAWLIAFSVFLFLSLAFAKRYIELLASNAPSGKLKSRGYSREDMDMVRPSGIASGYIAVLIFSLYIESPDVVQSYAAPQFLWLACPVLVYWISRVWFLAHRGQMEDDPVKFALRDRLSWLCGICIGGAAVLARFAPRLMG